jgi:hypothetical protein
MNYNTSAPVVGFSMESCSGLQLSERDSEGVLTIFRAIFSALPGITLLSIHSMLSQNEGIIS